MNNVLNYNWLDTSSSQSIVKSVIKRFRLRKAPFNNFINVEDWIPSNLDKDKETLFLFLSVGLDYGMRSVVLYKGMQELIKNYDVLDLSFFQSISEEKLPKIMRQYLHVRYPNNASKYWIYNVKKLLNENEGKVFNLISKTNFSAKAFLKEIKTYKGYGDKTASLLLRSIVNQFNIKFNDIWDVDMPIDRHKLRLSYEWRLITKKDFEGKNTKKISDIFKKACKASNISWLEFDKAFWILGSTKGKVQS